MMRMQDTLITQLAAKDDKYAYALAEQIMAESRETDAWYEYVPHVAKLLDHPKSLVRNRAIGILAANAIWDENGSFAPVLQRLLRHLADEKPITCRCCIKALAEVGLAQPRYVPLIVAALDALDAGQYPESMRPLIERDVAEAKRRLAAD